MASERYSFSLTTFSPRYLQISNAFCGRRTFSQKCQNQFPLPSQNCALHKLNFFLMARLVGWVRLYFGSSMTSKTYLFSGKLVQIEYALQAVSSGAPSVGIKVTDNVFRWDNNEENWRNVIANKRCNNALNYQAVNGCVLATEKKNKSILFEDHSTYKIEQVFTQYLSLTRRI